MIIRNGHDSKPIQIDIIKASHNNKIAEFWIHHGDEEKLGYITIEELISLRDEINITLKQMIGV